MVGQLFKSTRLFLNHFNFDSVYQNGRYKASFSGYESIEKSKKIDFWGETSAASGTS